jgi:hypothetical protein
MSQEQKNNKESDGKEHKKTKHKTKQNKKIKLK